MRDIKEQGQGTIFKDSPIEVLTKAPAPVSWGVYGSVLIAFLLIGLQTGVVATFWQGTLIYLGALLFWTLFEYVFHRYINHLDHFFPENRIIRKFDYAIHGIHHEFPRDQERLIMPPAPGLLIIAILFGLFYLVMGRYVFFFLPGFLTGYLAYAIIHYATHRWKPPKFLKPLWRHHALHHYKYPDKAFGVSTPLWDYVFGTMPPRVKK